MKIDEIILSLIELADNKLRGKTLLQKQIYFLSVKLHIDFGYTAHYYGPYSPLVDYHLLNLKYLGFIKEDVYQWGVDNEGFEKKVYEFSLTQNGKQFLERIKTKNSDYKAVEDIINEIKITGALDDYVSLSIAAKTYHILAAKSSAMEANDIKKEASKLGWKIKDSSIQKAIELLTNLKLAESH